ncbi:hypothetical protein CMI47_06915 [Candidatus Pacearchaeota archaeon]|nr:hypothetical protein [Candidatus Pacearchaeota archaeon]|tara:strand:- start:1593 stop:3524 length:1932 start_codon:yes stop_codon:yes gene_type:complete
MAKSFTLEQLTEGIRHRNIGAEGQRLVEKWSRTGLLRGLADHNKEIMSRLLENQAAQLLREQNSLSTGAANMTTSGDLRGFTNIAFPIVRRVFGGLVSNELVSIQPMSLPSGLLFYLDYTYGTRIGGDSNLQTGAAGAADAQTYGKGQSIYNNPTGKGVQSGSLATGGQYDLVGTSYTKVHSSSIVQTSNVLASGAFQGNSTLQDGRVCASTGTDGRLLQFDPQLTTLIDDDTAQTTTGEFQLVVLDLASSVFNSMDTSQAKDVSLFTDANLGSDQGGGGNGLSAVPESVQGGKNLVNVRRLNQVGTFTNGQFTSNPLISRTAANAALLVVVTGSHKAHPASVANLTASYVLAASLDIDTSDGSALTIPSFESDFASSPSPAIPEIDIKIESIAVTAQTRKLRARWSPELAQDLNAYHSMDAEVELTQILSEQVALEIDREILNDLLVEAAGANYYWSRMPGKFVNKTNGNEVNLSSTLASGPSFTGTVREWYETLVETIIDVANEIHRKTLRGSANFIVCSPEVSTVFEASVLYKPNYSLDGDGQVGNPFTLGAAPVGTLSNRFTVYKDPYFPRNKVLVGYKGGSYLETGYVYAPYVPLIVTPTIFAPEDFTPRKGVMTRYGKKMVRADFYGTVTVMDLNVI